MVALSEILSGFEDEAMFECIGFDDIDLQEMMPEVAAAPSQPYLKKGKSPPVRIVLRVHQVALVERALSATGLMNRAAALLEICKHYEERQFDVVG